MPITLIVSGGAAPARELYLSEEAGVIGRSSTCQILLPVPQVSRRHAELHWQGGQWYVRDLDSANGTFVNGRKLAANESCALQPQDRIGLGPETELTVKIADAPQTFGFSSTGPLYEDEEPPKRRMSPPVVAAIVVAVIAVLAAAGYFAWRALSGEESTAQATVVPAAATAGNAQVKELPPVVTSKPPVELPAAAPALPVVSLPTVSLPAVAPALPAAPPAPAQAAPAAAMPQNATLEGLPQQIAALFPNTPPDKLPQAIQSALQSGQVKPDQARQFIDTLFPGVPPDKLPAAFAGSYAGFTPDQIQSILGTIYPGQQIKMPDLTSRSGAVVFAAISEDGKSMHIYQMNADGTNKQVLIQNGSEPAFSPDGKRLAYYSWRSDSLGLHVRNLTTGDDKRVTSGDNDSYPSWAPDGNRIVFWDTVQNTIQTINTDGSDRRPVTHGEFPAWSPRGDRIAIKGCVGNDCGIVLVNPDGSNPVRISTNANDGQPAWSPDGRSVTFVSNRDGNWEIYVVNADGSWLRRVTDDPHTDGLPAWASDNIRVAFRSDRSGAWAIYTTGGIGGPAFKLTDAPVISTGHWQWTFEKITWR